MVAFLLAICLLLFCYEYIFLAQQRERISLRQQCTILRQEIKISENFARMHPDAEQYQTELEAKKSQVDKLLPDSVDIGDFLLKTEKIADNAGIKLLSVRPGSILQKQDYCEIPVEIKVAGDYFHILDFYRQLQALRLNTVKNLYIANKQGLLESKLLLVIFSYKK